MERKIYEKQSCDYCCRIDCSACFNIFLHDTTLTLNNTNVDAKENSSFNMTASINSTNTSVTWKSSNTAVATINSSGVVTTKKAGTTIITATHTASNGTKYTADCTVYVRIDDGVYYIQNTNSSYYAHVSGGGIANGINVFQYEKYPSTTSDVIKIRQMWKIKYLSAGRYSVRPLHILSSGLHVTNTNVDIYDIGTTDTRSGVSDSAEWVIEWDSTAYLFKNNGENGKTMQIENTSTSAYANIIVSSYSAGANCKWNLSKVSSPPVGAYLYDTEKEKIVTTATKNIVYKQSNSLNDIGIKAIYYSGDSIDQTFSWSSSNTSVVRVDSNSAVTGVSCGEATITGCVEINGTCYYVSYIINVLGLLIYQTENTYYYDVNGNYAEDLVCGDMTQDELTELDWVNWSDFVLCTPEILRFNWEEMCVSLFSTGELEAVVLDMIDHFMEGTGSSYSNSILTQKIYEHDSTQEYIKNIEEQLEILINSYDGDISALSYIFSTRDSNPLVIALREKNIYQPVYNSAFDKTNGLTICVDGLWGNKIEVTSYSISGNEYSCILHYTLYDHFGLDQADVETYGPLAGFRSWYVLQHYSEYNSEYKPFLSIIEFDVVITGYFS